MKDCGQFECCGEELKRRGRDVVAVKGMTDGDKEAFGIAIGISVPLAKITVPGVAFGAETINGFGAIGTVLAGR